MGQVGPYPAAGRSAPNGVTHDAARGEKYFLAPASQLGGWGESGVSLRGKPAGKAVGTLGNNQEAHLGMLLAAVLGALAAVDAGGVGLQPKAVVLAWYQVSLLAYGGRPKAVNHVSGEKLQRNRPSHRDVELIGRGEPVLGYRITVLQLPPPLVANDPDLQGLLPQPASELPAHRHIVDQKSEQDQHGQRR